MCVYQIMRDSSWEFTRKKAARFSGQSMWQGKYLKISQFFRDLSLKPGFSSFYCPYFMPSFIAMHLPPNYFSCVSPQNQISPSRFRNGGGAGSGGGRTGQGNAARVPGGAGLATTSTTDAADEYSNSLHASAATSFGDLIPLDAAMPLGKLEHGAEGAATIKLTAARTGLARLSTLCLRDTVTGAVYAPAFAYEVFVE